jgi:hypothetical protein
VRDVPQHLPLAFGERLDRRRWGLIGEGRRGREPSEALGRSQQAAVSVGQNGVTS